MIRKELITTIGTCVCVRLFKRYEPMRGAIIREDSNKNIWSDGYKPILSENGEYYLTPEDYTDMSEPKKISELSGDDAAAIAALLRKVITVASTGSTVTDSFFSNTITAIGTEGQYYLKDVHFTQSGTTITGINGVTFSNGQVITVYL